MSVNLFFAILQVSRTDANVLLELDPEDMHVEKQSNYTAVLPEAKASNNLCILATKRCSCCSSPHTTSIVTAYRCHRFSISVLCAHPQLLCTSVGHLFPADNHPKLYKALLSPHSVVTAYSFAHYLPMLPTKPSPRVSTSKRQKSSQKGLIVSCIQS